MIPPTLSCARAVRDGGIDAMAALDSALPAALAGLSPEQASEVKRAVGRIMGEIIDTFINPAIRAFPELQIDKDTWGLIARQQAAARSARA